MKRRIIMAIFLLSSIHAAVAQLKSEVNECFELTSIVFRLAGANEYVNNQLAGYTSDIDNYFAKHKDHKIISYIKEELREKQAIGYDAVPIATIFLEIRNGKIIIKSGLNPSLIQNLDNRWTEQSFKIFINLLNDFYKKTQFRKFYTQHFDLYKIAEERADELLKYFDIEWFDPLFKEEVQEPLVIISLCNGPHNYAFQTFGERKTKGMVIGSASDAKGLPTYNSSKLFTITHEFLHSYTNSIIYDNWGQIEPAANTIFSHVKEELRKNAYASAQTMMCEWLANLLSFMYVKDNLYMMTNVEDMIAERQDRGFIWLGRSYSFMKNFKANREQFGTIEDYMPQLVGFLNYTADNFGQVANEYNNRRPYVVETFPAQGTSITSNIDTVEIRFSEKMAGIYNLGHVEDENIMRIPWTKPSWNKELTILNIPLDKEKLETGKTYGVRLISKDFLSNKSYPMKEDFVYTFTIVNK